MVVTICVFARHRPRSVCSPSPFTLSCEAQSWHSTLRSVRGFVTIIPALTGFRPAASRRRPIQVAHLPSRFRENYIRMFLDEGRELGVMLS